MNDSVGLKKIFTDDSEKIKTGVLYLMMISGGLWHFLGMFHSTMVLLAAPVIILLGVWLLAENWLQLKEETETLPHQPPGKRLKFLLWAVSVVPISIFIEWLGVKTGIIFGPYKYGETLPPFLDGVPVAIGFAWLGMLLASLALTRKWQKNSSNRRILIPALLTALFMTVFDLFMEPAAVKLGYWSWLQGTVPLKNYAAWFTISFLFIYPGLKFNVLPVRMRTINRHAYYGQLTYFLLVYLK